MMTVGLGLVGACLVFLIYKEKAMLILVGFGFGGSLAALFMRVGGGIFTKAADVGADLVGKVEAGIPEDDPRNPATIADNVGDNVGDCAGMAADVFESYEVTLVAAIILGAAIIPAGTWGSSAILAHSALQLVMYPLIVRAAGVFASIIGVLAVKGADREDLDPMKPINMGFYVSAALATLFFGIGSYVYFKNGLEVPSGDGHVVVEWWRFFACTFLGIILALVIGWMTEYFTSVEKKPVREIAYNSKTGPATMIISGFSYGLESSVWSALAIALTLVFALSIFPNNALLAAYGIALAGLGLLTTTGFILAMDTFGPITDNANGIFEMSGVLEEDAAARTDNHQKRHVGTPYRDQTGRGRQHHQSPDQRLCDCHCGYRGCRAVPLVYDGRGAAGSGHPAGSAGSVYRPAHWRRGSVPVLQFRHQRGRARGLPVD